MKALSIRQPSREDLAYIAGALHGDAWLTRELGLRVADRDFADAFQAAAARALGITASVRRDERGYWLFRATNKTARFDGLKALEPATDSERGAWLRGLFDSEGNAQLMRLRRGTASFSRRVSMYSTEFSTLARAADLLLGLGIRSSTRATRNSAGHKGSKVVYELRVLSSRQQYRNFAERVGSSIARKTAILASLPESYAADLSGAYRAAQLLGAKAKHRKTMGVTLPGVVAGVRDLIVRGVTPTQRACRAIRGYNTVQKWVPQAELVAMARAT